MVQPSDIIIGIDAGTSVIKSIAFDLDGRQIAGAATPNRYTTRADGAAFQPLDQTWADCAETLRALGDKVPGLAERTIAIAVTGQGDGTWLVGPENKPVTDGWLWLDARSAPKVAQVRGTEADERRFRLTGTGLNSCMMNSQLAHMKDTTPAFVEKAEVAFHCKDWLYLNLTGARATDPSEACFTFGNFRTRSYDPEVIDALGLTPETRLLPPITDGSEQTHPLSDDAAKATGLRAGTPVSLGYVDVVCTAIGAGIYSEQVSSGCTIIGSTGMHMRACAADAVQFNAERTGYVMPLPIPGVVAQIQSNMASTLNIDWLLNVGAELATELGQETKLDDMIDRVEAWIASSPPAQCLFQPYISEAGERGPFVDNAARAGFVGLSTSHRFSDMLRGVVEGLGLAARDCYAAMGGPPTEVRLSGGAARSDSIRRIHAAALGTTVRRSERAEAGAAGAAMMAAVANGVFPDMRSCIAAWVDPQLSTPEEPDSALSETYADLFPAYVDARRGLAPVWAQMADIQGSRND